MAQPSDRSFGLSVGSVLGLIAGALVWRGHTVRAELLGGLGALLIVFGLVYPAALRVPAAWWWRLARVLAWVNTRVLLTVLFVLVLTPVALLWRLIGKDPLTRTRAKWPGWSPYPARYRDGQHFTRMY